MSQWKDIRITLKVFSRTDKANKLVTIDLNFPRSFETAKERFSERGLVQATAPPRVFVRLRKALSSGEYPACHS